MKRSAVVIGFCVLFAAFGTGAETDPVQRAIDVLEEEPVTRMEYGLHRAGFALEDRLSVITRHPAGPRSLAVSARLRERQLVLLMTAIYNKESHADCEQVIKLIKRELRLNTGLDPAIKEERAGDLFETWFMDAIARYLVSTTLIDLTLYQGSNRGARRLFCRSLLTGEEVEERRAQS